MAMSLTCLPPRPPVMSSERFTVRWCRRVGFPAGYAIFDGERAITMSFETRHEAERRRDNIAVLYEQLGFGPLVLAKAEEPS